MPEAARAVPRHVRTTAAASILKVTAATTLAVKDHLTKAARIRIRGALINTASTSHSQLRKWHTRVIFWEEAMKALIFSACLCVVGFSHLTFAENEPKQFSSLQSPNGRYVFGQISTFRRDQFMLDTQTGRLWEIVTITGKPGEESFQVLRPIWYQRGKDLADTPDQ
jgi:hypothetical protein